MTRYILKIISMFFIAYNYKQIIVCVGILYALEFLTQSIIGLSEASLLKFSLINILVRVRMPQFLFECITQLYSTSLKGNLCNQIRYGYVDFLPESFSLLTTIIHFLIFTSPFTSYNGHRFVSLLSWLCLRKIGGVYFYPSCWLGLFIFE